MSCGKIKEPQRSPPSSSPADLLVKQTVIPDSTNPVPPAQSTVEWTEDTKLDQLLAPDSDRKGELMIIPGNDARGKDGGGRSDHIKTSHNHKVKEICPLGGGVSQCFIDAIFGHSLRKV